MKSTAYELWCPRTIEEMLTNETYIGNLTQGRRRKLNYKSKKEIRTPKEEWIITECFIHFIFKCATIYIFLTHFFDFF